MARHKVEKFNFSHLSERLMFQVMNPDGSYSNQKTVWAHVLKDGFIRTNYENWFRIVIREQKDLEPLLAAGTRLKWNNVTLSVLSWAYPSYENKRFIEILAKQIVTSIGVNPGPADSDLFKDVVSVFKLDRIEKNRFGVTTYEYNYNFDIPNFTGLRCNFSSDRNLYVDNKKTDVEHDSLIVLFNIDAPISVEDYIESPVHGRFKIDMLLKNNDDMLQAFVTRSEVQ